MIESKNDRRKSTSPAQFREIIGKTLTQKFKVANTKRRIWGLLIKRSSQSEDSRDDYFNDDKKTNALAKRQVFKKRSISITINPVSQSFLSL